MKNTIKINGVKYSTIEGRPYDLRYNSSTYFNYETGKYELKPNKS